MEVRLTIDDLYLLLQKRQERIVTGQHSDCDYEEADALQAMLFEARSCGRTFSIEVPDAIFDRGGECALRGDSR